MKKKISPNKRIKILNKYNGKCAYCGKELDYEFLNIDHIIPNQDDDLNNLNPSCKSCNSRKHSKSLEDFRELSTRIKLHIPSFTDEQKDWLYNTYFIDINGYIQERLIHFHFEEFKG